MAERNCKVSVIIPVYNTERYVRETVQSACNQTLQDIEIICINDGSTDGSENILSELAEQDKRIRVINQPNSGQSVARNTGIINAKGKYIYFLDSDDLIESNTLESCYNLCEKRKYDFVTFDYDIYNPDHIRSGNTYKWDRNHCLYENISYTGIDSLNYQLEKMRYTVLVQLLFINISFLKKIKLRFYPKIIHEDQLFTALLYLKAKRMAYIQRQFFHRRIRLNSIMTTRFSWKNVQGYLIVTDELIMAKKKFDQEACESIDIILSRMLDSIVRWEAYKLPRKKQLSLAFICFKKYMRYIKWSSIFYLFAKSLLKKKDH